jgi:hypothetical protein
MLRPHPWIRTRNLRVNSSPRCRCARRGSARLSEPSCVLLLEIVDGSLHTRHGVSKHPDCGIVLLTQDASNALSTRPQPRTARMIVVDPKILVGAADLTAIFRCLLVPLLGDTMTTKPTLRVRVGVIMSLRALPITVVALTHESVRHVLVLRELGHRLGLLASITPLHECRFYTLSRPTRCRSPHSNRVKVAWTPILSPYSPSAESTLRASRGGVPTTGFEPVASRLPCACSNRLSYDGGIVTSQRRHS